MRVLILLVCVSLAASQLLFDSFDEWKAHHNKEYESAAEETKRARIWSRNAKYVRSFNSDKKNSYVLSMNEFTDLKHREFQHLYLSKVNMAEVERTGSEHVPSGNALPSSVDWRSKGYVTPVKNQGQCGSCWAFSTTGSLEGQHFKKNGTLVSLSEQNLVDCSGKEGNQGCNGGLMDDAFNYIKENGGIDTESSYPYLARDSTCNFKASDVGATVAGHTDVKSKNEDDLQDAVANVGPVSVAIDASHPSFQMYHSGVYDPFFCSSTKLDHGVLVVGYGTESSKDYWLVKNSWGAQWGDQGYIKMIRNDNDKCGVATSASYPLV